MNFTDLEYFRYVARLENLSLAAQELFISQPGLSRSMSRLEKDLGIQLFKRRKGKLELTIYGQILATSVNQAFETIERGIGQVKQLQSDNENTITVACMIDDFMVDRLKEFSAIHPQIGIRQASGTQDELERQIVQRRLDLAICAHPFNHKKIRFEELSCCPNVLLVNETNPLSSANTVDLHSLKNEAFICENPRFNRVQLETLCTSHGFIPKVTHEVENAYVLFNMIEAGKGISIVPYAYFQALRSKFPGHHLRTVDITDNVPPAVIGIAYLPENFLSPPAVMFINYLREYAAREKLESNT